MATQIQSMKLELQTLYLLCNTSGAVQSALLSRIDQYLFNHATTVAAWRRIRSLVKNKGRLPSWDDLTEDTTIDVDSRSILAKFKTKRKLHTLEDVDVLVESLTAYKRIRGHLELVELISDKLDSDDGYDPSDVDKAVETVIAKYRTTSGLLDGLINFGVDSNAEDLIDTLLDQSIKPNLIKTGFHTYDTVNGGLPLGELVVIAGSTGGGKSLVGSVQLLKNMSLYAPTCLVPLEMGKEAMTARLASNVSGINVGKILQKKLTEGEVKKVKKSFRKWETQLEEQDSRYSILEPEYDVTIEEILYGVQHLGFKVVLIDYISLLKGELGMNSGRS